MKDLTETCLLIINTIISKEVMFDNITLNKTVKQLKPSRLKPDPTTLIRVNPNQLSCTRRSYRIRIILIIHKILISNRRALRVLSELDDIT